MIFRKLFPAALLLAIAVTGAPGQAATILNVENHPVSSAQHSLSMRQIEKAIIRAGAQRGWVIQRSGPGHLIARVDIRTHTAVVDITYSRQSFSITYNSSENLNYRKGNIHRNYNRWVNNLRADIFLQVNKMAGY